MGLNFSSSSLRGPEADNLVSFDSHKYTTPSLTYKLSHQTTESSPINGATESDVSLRGRIDDFYELTKPRLSFMSVVTAVAGYLSADPIRDFSVLFSLLVGTSLAAGGAAVLNQWLEREADAKMVRTKDRAIPAGRITPIHAFIYGMGLSILGCWLLYKGANLLACTLTAATIASYVLLYTPLKRFTTWNTLVGAIPGALPPLIGWAAAEGRISTLGWILFAILFLWQMPHFFAIAWTHRKDYAQGGFVMLSNADSTGQKVRDSILGILLGPDRQHLAAGTIGLRDMDLWCHRHCGRHLLPAPSDRIPQSMINAMRPHASCSLPRSFTCPPCCCHWCSISGYSKGV